MTTDATPALGEPMACPVCGERDSPELWRLGDRLFATTARTFSIRRCGSCGTDYLDPPPDDEELATYYPDSYWVVAGIQEQASVMARVTEFYRRTVLRDHLRFVRRVIDEQIRRGVSPRVVDVGCGDGSYLQALGAEPSIGIDLSLPALRAGRARGVTNVLGTLYSKRRGTAPFADGSFSLITSFHFLEHIADPYAVLREMRRLLRSDGDLVIQVPNKDSWQARILGARWSGLDVPRHLVNYSTDTLCRVLEECGFEVLRQSHFSLRDGPMTLANSLVPGLYPPARDLRLGGRHGGLRAWSSRVVYLMVTLASLPLALLESAVGRGAAVMVQARPRARS